MESLVTTKEFSPPLYTFPLFTSLKIFKMFTILPTTDGICFALRCKFTLAFYLEILRVRGRTMPVKPQRMFLGVKIFPWFRIHLLRRLQNPRWKFCAQCWTLHPRSVWNIQPFWRLNHKACSYGCHTFGSRKCYLPYAGEWPSKSWSRQLPQSS